MTPARRVPLLLLLAPVAACAAGGRPVKLTFAGDVMCLRRQIDAVAKAGRCCVWRWRRW
ncbi:MAG: hypothetical protein J6T01_01655 [Kiritimatiellae bacterium]|nr:hypothetical protein [Kiritimatiellia bacterium]